MGRSGADRMDGAGALESADETSTSAARATSPPCAEHTVLGRSEPPLERNEAPPGSNEASPGSNEPMPGSSAPRSRREEILDGATEMFAEHGFYGSSLREIGKHIGISHSGMLHHFETKDALLEGVLERLEDHAQSALERIPELRAGREALVRGMVEIWDPASLHIQLLAVLEAESVSEEHPGRYRLARLRRVHEHTLASCFLAFAGRGELHDGIDPEFAGRTLLAAVLNLAVREKTVRSLQRQFHDDAPIAELVRQVDALLDH